MIFSTTERTYQIRYFCLFFFAKTHIEVKLLDAEIQSNLYTLKDIIFLDFLKKPFILSGPRNVPINEFYVIQRRCPADLILRL